MTKFRKFLLCVCAAALMIVAQTSASTSAQSTCNTQHKCNCVLWVRCARVPSLPYGLNTMQDKKNIINSYTPAVGSVAIMNVGKWGHVGYVAAVNKDSRGNVISIKVEEANYTPCVIGSRTGSPSTLKVVGYYRPR
ncbi:MAG: CHAP domain-containing protein [Acidobacteria bacterium]|nr:CHAP domain-containing protein [Acidobacteriota bacterium]